LVAQYPLMDEYLEQGIAVSVDGTMYRDDWDVSIPPGVEVVLLPRIQGG
ncbi:MAG: MoaD/ThiS family protein, partial [Gammaproteobacteria bacterium]|nr:MoaD/ThiS family protein [Gammaproteobacteria bacterium]